jgi:hypothetical protein
MKPFLDPMDDEDPEIEPEVLRPSWFPLIIAAAIWAVTALLFWIATRW